ncbi:hypothetical protein COMA1_80025 [Candidatus Nitrospira nitrosa]|uniref:Uncharacterized protein n=1 Tax=Candidatus Nitrospira nitrosa TaxID=1742972 RepID=A0A0S4LR64_9BACT|nr:hypothetical protein COMA1_80025 [Candidatus Nitrospira nitrosa]
MTSNHYLSGFVLYIGVPTIYSGLEGSNRIGA